MFKLLSLVEIMGCCLRGDKPLPEVILTYCQLSLWRHPMETFSALLASCAGNSSDPGEFPAQRPVTRSFDVFFDLRMNNRLSKQSWSWWFKTPSHPLWRHGNVLSVKSEYKHDFLSIKCILKCHLLIGQPFCSGLDTLSDVLCVYGSFLYTTGVSRECSA